MAKSKVLLYDSRGNPVSSRVNNRMKKGSVRTFDRPAAPMIAEDFHRNLSVDGWRLLLCAGRWMKENISPLASAIRLRSQLCVGNDFTAQFDGKDKAWGNKAEEALWNWDKICDVKGQSYDFATNLKLWLEAVCVDGDVGVVLTETDTGYPQIQTIPAHRIGTPSNVKDARVINGVLTDNALRPLRYYVVDGNELVDTVDASELHLFYTPKFADQVRGYSELGDSINDWQDWQQIIEFIKLQLKKEASFAVHVSNEAGGIDIADSFNQPIPQDGQSSETATVYTQLTDGGLVEYSRIGASSKIEFPSGNRPSVEFQSMMDRLMRSAFASIDWPLDFYDATKIGGAPLRFQMELVQRSVEKQQALAQKMASRIHSWVVAKLIKRGDLEPNPEWWMWSHQPPPAPTADKGWDSQINREEFLSGILTFDRWCKRAGLWPEDVRAANLAHTEQILTQAKELANRFGVTTEYAAAMLQQRGTNGINISQAETSSEVKNAQ